MLFVFIYQTFKTIFLSLVITLLKVVEKQDKVSEKDFKLSTKV